MHKRKALATAFLVAAAAFSLALRSGHEGGQWPKSWPAALEPLRERAHTYQIMTGIQEDVYQIPFADRDEFERVWPTLAGLADRGGVLTLASVEPQGAGSPATSQPAVRIAATPQSAAVKIDETRSVPVGPPWPDSIRNAAGELPAYVWWNGSEWAAVPEGGVRSIKGFMFRARVDLTLAVDGDVIDLNRIRLPQNVRVIDRRPLPGAEPAATTTAPASK